MSSPGPAVNECPLCRKTFSLRTNLTRHVKRLHGEGHKEVTKPLTCSACGMQCRDNYQLKTHERSHSKEKPFKCSLCIYKSSRKEDVERHMKRCKGPKYNCGNCGQMFRSKIAVTDHMNWDSNCGNLGDQNVKQDVVKIAINKDTLVLGVNCSELMDQAVFEKRRRKTRCGVCYGCSLEEDCGQCRACVSDNSGKLCVRRGCLTPVALFRPRQGLVSSEKSAQQTLPASENETCITMNADVIQL